MNTLILSSGGTGSTILQRLLTLVYYIEKIEIVNTHDIVNKFMMLDDCGNVKRDGTIQYGQTLEEIQQILLNSNRKTKLVSRLSKDHVDFRNDDSKDRHNFFNFINKFYEKKIFCDRKNTFELAMSLAIKEKSKIYNIFSNKDRESVHQVDSVDEKRFLHYLKGYTDYRIWITKNFDDSELIYYEDVITDTDNVMYKMTGYKDTLKRYFGAPMASILRAEHDDNKSNMVNQNALTKYKTLCDHLVEKQILRLVPVKNTSLRQKKSMIKNFKRCLKFFDRWTDTHNFVDKSVATYDFWNQKRLTI